MIPPLIAVLAAVALSPPFAQAGATAVRDGAYIAVTVEVELAPGFAADYLVVHVLNPDGQETFTLGATGLGSYEGTFTILPFNRALVFEAGRAGEFALSRTVSLLELGVEAEQLQTTFGRSSSSVGTSKWGWLALAAGALAGAALLIYWAWPKPPSSRHRLMDTAGTATVVDETDPGE